MNILRQITQITIGILLISSCAKLPIYQPVKIEQEPSTDNLRYYKESISYDIFYDDNNIHVHLVASDYISQVKILRLGFTLWLDQKGKKSKDIGIIFPQKQPVNNSRMNENRRMVEQANMNSQEIRKILIAQLHSQFMISPKIMTLIGLDGKNSEEIVNTELEKSDIHVSISFDTLNNLHYKAVIPVTKIFTEEKYQDDIFSVGFESGAIEMSSMGAQQGRSGGSKGRMSGGGSGMSGGGRQGGGMGGQGSRQGGGGGAGPDKMRSAMAEPIKIWFKVSLKPITD